MVRVSKVGWDSRYVRVEDLDREGKSLGTVRIVPMECVILAVGGIVFGDGTVVAFVWVFVLN